MPVNYEVKNDHTEEFLEELKEAISIAMERCGMEAVSFASAEGTGAPRDTGHLAQSITFATKGKPGVTRSSASKPGAEIPQTVYTEEENCMYIGTNVFYAPYQEYGTHNGVRAHHFIKNSLQGHESRYKDIIEEECGGLTVKWGKP